MLQPGGERSISGKETVHAQDVTASLKQVFVCVCVFYSKRTYYCNAEPGLGLVKQSAQVPGASNITVHRKMCLPGPPRLSSPCCTTQLTSFLSIVFNLEGSCLLTSSWSRLTWNVSAIGRGVSLLYSVASSVSCTQNLT